MTPATITTIELAWWLPGRAFDVALCFKGLTWRDVAKIWAKAKRSGRLPNIRRPAGGFAFAQLLAMQAQAVPIIDPRFAREARAA